MLLNQIMYQMICEGDSGIAIQLSQVIRLLLDPENMALTANVSQHVLCKVLVENMLQ
jgi:hypothetical protein